MKAKKGRRAMTSPAAVPKRNGFLLAGENREPHILSPNPRGNGPESSQLRVDHALKRFAGAALNRRRLPARTAEREWFS